MSITKIFPLFPGFCYCSDCMSLRRFMMIAVEQPRDPAAMWWALADSIEVRSYMVHGCRAFQSRSCMTPENRILNDRDRKEVTDKRIRPLTMVCPESLPFLTSRILRSIMQLYHSKEVGL